ncbi:unnamed protein product [Symbiodinium natans]|uniref:Uncharacterized protein n=1 Tax=Symbiodinium natans TaxID=878477 RepID=A0A812V3I4_9DINO|nr:unnamed protein product [Symbiodinium natans]
MRLHGAEGLEAGECPGTWKLRRSSRLVADRPGRRHLQQDHARARAEQWPICHASWPFLLCEEAAGWQAVSEGGSHEKKMRKQQHCGTS